jgi:hypothetical protein
MKAFLMAVCCLFIHLSSTAQRTPPTGWGIGTATYATVELFDSIGFAGQSKTLKADTAYRLSDFNDITSSIKVPPGLVAIIYEHVDNGGGYGISVDLMEDCPDLSRYNFNNITSYVSVLNSVTRITPRMHDGSVGKPQNYYFARSRITNGQFVPYSWNSERADGQLPDNSVAVVSPYIAPHQTTSPSVLIVNGPVTTITNLGVQSIEGAMLWETAMKDQLGIIGNDYRGIEEIGSACFERASNNPALPDNVNFWYPQKQPRDHRSVVYFKRTLSGTLKHTEVAAIDGTYEDHDLNIDIVPFTKYQYLINDGHPYEYTDIMSLEWNGTAHQYGQADCDHEDRSIVESEIYINPEANNNIYTILNNSLGRPICLYGVWLYDKGHCCHPEIHPAEQIWWNDALGNGKKYFCSVVCDGSDRFWWSKQMDNGTKLKPWGAPPVKGLFAIAFEYTFPLVRFHTSSTKKFEAAYIDHYNLIEYPNADQTYNLMYQDKSIVSFIPHNSAFKVSFEHVGMVPGSPNKIRGFLVIETSVGLSKQIATSISVPIRLPNGTYYRQVIKLPANSTPEQAPEQYEDRFFKKERGHYFFNITETNLITTDINFDKGGVIESIDRKKSGKE